MKSVASYLDRRLVGVAMDEQGMIPEALAELCRRQKIAAIYVTTRCQNPTNATLPLERREAIAEIARTQSGVGMSTGSATLIAVEIASRWILDNRLDAMIQWQQAENIRRLSLLATFPQLGQARSDVASPHVWLPLPEQWRAEDFIDAAQGHGIAIAQTHSFVVGRRPMPHAVRLCIGSPPSVEALQIACEQLERLLGAQPKSSFDT